MLIDLHGGPFWTTETEFKWIAGARATLRIGTDQNEYIWTLGLGWAFPNFRARRRYWWADAQAEEHSASVTLLGFRLYATWW